MLFAGLDMGLSTIKAVLLDEKDIIAVKSISSEKEANVAAQDIVAQLLKETGLNLEDINTVVSTGIGKKEVHLATTTRTEQICLAKGAYYLFPSARTVLDIGTGGCRALKLDQYGKLIDFASNSKCAAGTGSFLDAAARVLDLELKEMDNLALRAKQISKVSSYCAVFAESEIISNIHRGCSLESICAGICDSVMQRMLDVIRMVGIVSKVVLCGGVARNRAIINMFEAGCGLSVYVPKDALIIGALGAAVVARDIGLNKGRV